MGHRNNRPGNRRILAALPQTTNKCLIDLHVVHRDTFEVAQGRIPSAEIIDRQFHAEISQLLEGRDDVLDTVQQLAFGEFQLQVVRRQAGFFQYLAHQA